MISNPSNTGEPLSLLSSIQAVNNTDWLFCSLAFTTGLAGSITNSGPFDATIAFPAGLTVAWNGSPLGQIAMPNVGVHFI